jgi:hypothetical protein
LNTTNLTLCKDEFELDYKPFTRASHAAPYLLSALGLIGLSTGYFIRAKVWDYAKRIMQLNLMQSGAYLVLSIVYFIHFYHPWDSNKATTKAYLSLFNIMVILIFAGSLSNYLIAFQYLKSALAIQNPFRIKHALVFEKWFLAVSAMYTLAVQISIGVYILIPHNLTEAELLARAYFGLGYSLPMWLHYLLVF